MIAIVGLQGSGKTALRVALEREMANKGLPTISVKWKGSAENLAQELELDISRREYFDTLWALVEAELGAVQDESLICKYLRLPKEKYWDVYNLIHSKSGDLDVSSLNQMIPWIEKALGREKVNRLRFSLLMDHIANAHTVLVDFPDYSRKNTTQMNRDLDTFAAFWDSFLARDVEGLYGQKVNLVMFFQKELFSGHFFFGKLDVYELQPLTAQELVQYYINTFGSADPFTPKALMELAILSRGIFRRFKKYVRVCLDRILSSSANITITEELVKDWIGLDMLIQDAELELMSIFPKSREHRVLSVKLLKLLAEKGAIPQPVIVNEIFDGASMKASRVLTALESWGYIRRVFNGKNKVVELASWR